MTMYQDRTEAGRVLAQHLMHYAGRNDLVVLGLPRGGVPVAAEVARQLYAPLDVFLVRKLGVPGHEELAMGAIATGGVRVLNSSVIDARGISPDDVDRVAAAEFEELRRRERVYRGDRPSPDVGDRTVIVIDDGLATGASMRAALAALRRCDPRRLVAAVPVGAAETCERLLGEADELVCPLIPDPFNAVGTWYVDFTQTTDDEVREVLASSVKAVS